MKAAIDALVAFLRDAGAPDAVKAALGTNGPFWGIAPERTAFPFTVLIQMPGARNQYGFGAGPYIAKGFVQFSAFDVTAEGATANAEAICNYLDFKTLTLANGETCRKIRRLEEPRTIPADINESGVRAYQSITQYMLNVQRTVGV